ncbi:hypothetical protein N0V88_002924 [Collariella sp. IMI 366227]|nr:hypothetical protein N0V88_002924 [Collariella sp. IMI 366227]
MSEIKQGESYDADCPEFVNQYPFDPRLNDSGQQMYTFGEKPIPQAPLAHTWERSHPLIVPPFELPASPGQRPRGERRATVSGAPEPRWRKTQYFNTRRRSSSTHVFDRRSSPNDSSATLKDLEPLKSEVRRWSAPAADSTIANNCTGNHFLGTSVLPACPLKTRNSTTQVYDLPNQFWGLWSRPARARLSDARLDFTPPGAARPRNPHVRERPRGPLRRANGPALLPSSVPSPGGGSPLGGSTLCGDPLGSYVNGSDNDADVSSLASTLGQSLSNSPAARSESSSGLARLAGSYPIRELLTGFGVGFDDSDDTAVEGNAPGDGVVMVEEEEEEEGNGDGVRVIDYWGRCE